MRFTDIFIKKPVLSIVVSLFIVLLGLRAAFDLNVRQFPEIQNAVITVSTAYIGADAELIQGFITTPIEREVAAAEGIDYLVSTSANGVSVVQAYLRLDANPNEVLTEVAAQVNKVRGDLPEQSEAPVVNLRVGQDIAAMYMAFFSDDLGNNAITDYLVREVEPQLSTVPGVQRAEILGNRTFAMRAWLQPERMAALNITGSDVRRALQGNNVLAAVGSTKGQMVSVSMTAGTDLETVGEFRKLVVREDNGALVRLEDIAELELGSESYDTSVTFNGLDATFIGINVAPDANALDVIAEVRNTFDGIIVPQLPTGLNAEISYDSTEYIQSAINEVMLTIVLALVIVVVVIYLFIGSLRSAIIPAVAVPLSLIGTFFLMLLLGFSINLLTLLAMVLAIGIVVDDAIIMVENIERLLDQGKSRMEASIEGARQLAWPIVAMSTTLIAVFLPIGFVGGLTGTLFVEFAFTLAATTVLSGVVALTLSPMMCSRILRSRRQNQRQPKLEQWLNRRFEGLQGAYQRGLHGVLNQPAVPVVFGLIVAVSCYFLFTSSNAELEPQEDTGFIFMLPEADPYATLDYLQKNTAEIARIGNANESIDGVFLINGGAATGAGATNAGIGGMVLKPWDQRDKTTKQLLDTELTPALNQIPGLQVTAVVPPDLPTPGGGLPVQMVIKSTQPFENLDELAGELVQRGMQSGRFIFLDKDLKIDRPQQRVLIDREKAALMGVDMQQLAGDLAGMMSGGYVGRFSMQSRSYRVVPQVVREERLNPDQLGDFYTRNRQGEPVPMSALVSLESEVKPQSLKRFQQLNSVTISGVPRPGVTLGQALGVLEQAAAEILPSGVNIDYAGSSRQFKTEGQQLVVTFFFALVVIFLVLAAQFESFRASIIMLMTVPMSVCGAMIFVSLGITSLNIYTQVGLVTLIGLIAKHGILIVEFANKLQEEGRDLPEAIEEAAALRLRPILMTTAATVLAMVPLLVAAGPGAGARFAMGLVIAAGMTLGTLFTLFVVPAFYRVLAKPINTVEPQANEAGA